MIKLNNLDKYFNKRKPNEIHVLNNVNLTLPNKGLVVLLGPSGSGKTTLLNVLGGLDKVQSGSIEFEQEVIQKYNAKTWDKIRNKQVGYVFQNYNLLTNLTVYDNIALTLNMINIYDKEEIDKRIDYILDSMGMINYRKRRASQLSGGQQQRVAIARALAKNPKVIIADEPTGNLDSKNTQEIMTILKKISQNKLVVLVTHEENIANFYGDRIIRLTDGVITSDQENRSNGSLDVRHETDIYLGDLRKTDSLDSSNTKLNIFSDEQLDDDLDIRIIVKNKTIYLDVKSKEYQKMQLVESDSEINIFEGNYQEIKQDSFDSSDFNLESIITEKQDPKDRHSVISIKDSFRLAWNRIKSTSRLGKLFYAGFLCGSILIAFAIGMLNGAVHMDPEQFLQGSEDIVEFKKGDYTYSEIKEILDHSSVNYIEVVRDQMIQVRLPGVYQSSNNSTTIYESVVYSDYVDETKIIAGRNVEAFNEIIIDNDIADEILENSTYQTLGVNTYDDILELECYIDVYANKGSYEQEIKIVGIVKDNSEVIYVSKQIAFLQKYYVGFYEDYKDDITLAEGTLPVDLENQFIFADHEYKVDPIEHNTSWIFDEEFTASGAFTTTENVPGQLIYESTADQFSFDSRYKAKYTNVRVHSNDVDALIEYLTNYFYNEIDENDDLTEEEKIEAKENVVVLSSFDLQLTEYREDRLAEGLSTIIFNLVVLGASAISYFFILRSSLLSRIYEVSVYRALGVTKGDIRKLFTVEVILITSITSMIGYLGTTFILYRIQLLMADYFNGVIYISPLSILAGIGIIYGVNIIAGLIPVSNLLRKTPAEILSKYDF